MNLPQRPGAYGAQFPDHGQSAADHDKDLPTAVVVAAYYRVHPEDRQGIRYEVARQIIDDPRSKVAQA